MRHFIPTFAGYDRRREKRPDGPYDVMRVRDSWLCAHLADEQVRLMWRADDGEWQRRFDTLMRTLSTASWGACVTFYLTPRPH